MPSRDYRNGWKCVFSPDGISVSTATKTYGKYRLLTSPYCAKCSLPSVSTDQCRWHWKDLVERTYAMGAYVPLRSRDSRANLLSEHIRGLKRYVGYSVPLGWAMSLCVDNVYPELKKTDMIVPVPKHKDEFKVDRKFDTRYNQAEELARIIGKEIGLSVSNAVVKTRPHSQTKEGSWHSRIEVPEGVYIQSSDVSVRGMSVLLIDDVRTSGGTMSACAGVLLANGAETVRSYVAGREVLDGLSQPEDLEQD